MSTIRFSNIIAAVVGGVMLLTFSPSLSAQAQGKSERSVTVTPADTAAAAQVTNQFLSATPTRTTLGKASLAGGELILRSSSSRKKDSDNFLDRDDVRFPADLIYNGGPIVQFAQSHNVYMLPNGSCPISQCWGDPAGFLKSLARSDFIHLVDQYTGLSANNRYTLGEGAKVSYVPPKVPLTDNDVLAVVHAVASLTGDAGYGHIFHVFLPPGQDECFSSSFRTCYSPDNPNSFAFCAYHSSMDFPDIGHVLYSVEPFQNVPGCNIRPGTPNGQLIDSTNDTLSHETFETITDPDGDAWWNSASGGVFGEEIGDECVFLSFTPTAVFGDPFVYRIDDRLFATQPEYSNQRHGCAVH